MEGGDELIRRAVELITRSRRNWRNAVYAITMYNVNMWYRFYTVRIGLGAFDVLRRVSLIIGRVDRTMKVTSRVLVAESFAEAKAMGFAPIIARATPPRYRLLFALHVMAENALSEMGRHPFFNPTVSRDEFVWEKARIIAKWYLSMVDRFVSESSEFSRILEELSTGRQTIRSQEPREPVRNT